MKPSFALSLSFDGIQLLHRAAGGWRIVGNVDPQTADLTAELAALRDEAAALEPGDIRSKLLIPNDQIKYMTIESTGLSKEARTEAARAALQGATPYDVADLVFDTSADGTKTHIAAVARQTLTEAENFAVEHGFNPISCVAVPGEEGFLGEPYFGPNRCRRRSLGQGTAGRTRRHCGGDYRHGGSKQSATARRARPRRSRPF